MGKTCWILHKWFWSGWRLVLSFAFSCSTSPKALSASTLQWLFCNRWIFIIFNRTLVFFFFKFTISFYFFSLSGSSLQALWICNSPLIKGPAGMDQCPHLCKTWVMTWLCKRRRSSFIDLQPTNATNALITNQPLSPLAQLMIHLRAQRIHLSVWVFVLTMQR